MTLGRSPSAVRAKIELLRQCSLSKLEDFDVDSQVIHEDGSTYFVRNSFTRVWVDSVDTAVWIFLISEHNEPMCWDAGDLCSWASYKKLPTPESEMCPAGEGMGVVPNRMDLPDGPRCGCGLPSRLQDGSCGTNCDPSCKACKAIGWIWKSTPTTEA